MLSPKSESRAPEFVTHAYIYQVYLVIHYFWWLNFRCGANFRAPPSMSRDKTRPKNKRALKNAKKNWNQNTNKLDHRARKVGWYAWLSTERCPPHICFFWVFGFFAPHQAQLYMIVLSLFGDKKWSRKNNDKYAGIYFGGIFCRRVCHLMTFLLNAKWTSSAGGIRSGEKGLDRESDGVVAMLHCSQSDFLLKLLSVAKVTDVRLLCFGVKYFRQSSKWWGFCLRWVLYLNLSYKKSGGMAHWWYWFKLTSLCWKIKSLSMQAWMKPCFNSISIGVHKFISNFPIYFPTPPFYPPLNQLKCDFPPLFVGCSRTN